MHGAAGADMEDRLRQLRSGSNKSSSSLGQGRSRGKRDSGASKTSQRTATRRREGFGWSAVFLVTTLLCTAVVVVFLIVDRRAKARARARTATVTTPTQQPPEQPVPGSVNPIVPGPPVDSPTPGAGGADTQQFQDVMKQIHRFGGEESPELAALLNAEASATYQAASQQCTSANCENQRLARELFTPLKAPIPRAGRASGTAPRWLAGLKIPGIGAQDHPDVQRWVEYYTGHSVGRELFQTMLFRCGSYQDLITKTLVHYGLPMEMMAVVLTESACNPTAESAVGARGLWQFMAPTARAYHLLVEEGVVDERVSPVKSTEAAAKFLSDLYRKMNNWEMVFASYNAGGGPFRMMARIRQAGETATFWDLADAELLPEETAKYVPRIQAYAVILANLRHFDFSTAQMRTSEETADIQVPAGARLGQVARAAGTSVAYLRSLNPDLIGTVIPALPTGRFVLQVPKGSAFRAREGLDQFLQENLDVCVSSAFDWGREQFTAEMQAKCAARRK